MNTAQRLFALQCKHDALMAEVNGMKAHNDSVHQSGNNDYYTEEAFNSKADELRALPAELEKEATPVSQPVPRHPLDPLYKVGQVVISIEGGKPFCIQAIKPGWYYRGMDAIPTIWYAESMIKPYIPTFAANDWAEVLDVPVGVLPSKERAYSFVSTMKQFCGKKFQVEEIEPNGTIRLKDNECCWDPSWLVKVEPERTVNPGEWWLLPESSILRQVDRMSNLDVYFVGLITAWNITYVLCGKQFRIEEIK